MAESSRQSGQKRRLVRGAGSGNVPFSQRNTDSWINTDSFPDLTNTNSPVVGDNEFNPNLFPPQNINFPQHTNFPQNTNYSQNVDLPQNTIFPQTLDFDLESTPSTTPSTTAGNTRVGDNEPGSSAAPKRKHKSLVWKYFDLNTNASGKSESATCSLCKVVYKHKNSWGTGQLKTHLLNVHQIDLDSSTVGGDNMVQQTINQQTGQTFHYNHMNTRVGMAKFIAGRALPFTIASSDEMRDFFQGCLQPAFKPIPRQTVTKDSLDLYKRMKKGIISTLQNLPNKVCFTSDMWSSQNGLEVICVTCHWIDSDWLLQKRIICYRAVTTSHTGDLIADIIIGTALAYKVSDKLLTITFDNASNNTASIPKIMTMFNQPISQELFHVRCACHVINLIVQDGLDKIKESISRIRTALRNIKTSGNWLREYKNQCFTNRNPYRSIKLDIPTRWNSTYDILVYALRFRNEITMVNNTYNRMNFIDAIMWSHAENMCNFLHIFKIITSTLSGVYYPTSHLVLTAIFNIYRHLEAYRADIYIGECIDGMLDKLLKYYEPFPFTFSMAACMDPRIKLEGIRMCMLPLCNNSENQTNNYMDTLRNLLNNLYDNYVGQHGRGRRPPLPTQPTQASGFAAYFRLEISTLPVRPSTSSGINELAFFLGQDREDYTDDFDVLEWWKEKSRQFPILSLLARDLLTIPASSVASESAFSAGKRQLDEKRSRMTGKTLEVLVSLQDWEAAERRTQNMVDAHNSSDDTIFSDMSSNDTNSPIESDDAANVSEPQIEDDEDY